MMKAIQLSDNLKLVINEIPVPVPGEGECLVRIHCAALNRRDYWIQKGKYPGIVPGVTLGSDGCGTVEAGDPELVGEDVIINPNVGWGNNPGFQSSEYSVLGMPTNGTLAEYMAVPSHRLHKKPGHLSREEAASVPLAGMTAFRACFGKSSLSKGDKVLITGIGGGVAQMAMAYAKAEGCEVIVTSGSHEKIGHSIKLGATNGFNYNHEHWTKRILDKNGKMDVVIDSAGGENINAYLKIIKPAGNIVVYGATTGRVPQFDLFRLFWSQASVIGTTMANDEEFTAMVNYLNDKTIHPVIDKVLPLDSYEDAFARFEASDHFGKIVVRI